MVVRRWLTSMCVAVGVASAAAAAQLGLGYGLGIITWLPAADGQSLPTGYAALTWSVWIATTSTLIGALAGARTDRDRPAGATARAGARGVLRCGVALAAALGALVTVPLAAIPVQVTQDPPNSSPAYVVGGYVLFGVAIGLLAAVWALTVGAVAANAVAWTVVVWALAVGLVTAQVRQGGAAGTAELGAWQFDDAVWVRGIVDGRLAAVMLAVALVIGVGTAWPAARRGDSRVGVAISGAAGPTLVAAAYLLTGPAAAQRDALSSVYVVAPYAILTGLVGSALAATFGSGFAARRSRSLNPPAADASIPDWSAPANSAPAKIEPAKIGPVKSGPAKRGPGASSPHASSQVTSDPDASSPVTSDPDASSPVTSDPGASSPVTSDPGASGSGPGDEGGAGLTRAKPGRGKPAARPARASTGSEPDAAATHGPATRPDRVKAR